MIIIYHIRILLSISTGGSDELHQNSQRIVGCGKVGHTHAQALQTLPESELVAVCGRDAQRTAALPASTESRRTRHAQDDHRTESSTDQCLHSPSCPCRGGGDCGRTGLSCPGGKNRWRRTWKGVTGQSLRPAPRGQAGVISQRRLYPRWCACRRRLRPVKSCAGSGDPGMMGWRSPEYYLMDPGAAVGMPKGRGDGQPDRTPDRPVAVADGPVVELFGYWENFNHPSVEVEDTAVAVMRFKSAPSGRFAEQLAETGFLGKDPYSRSNGASVGAQTEAVRPLWRVSRPKSNHPSTTSGLFRRRGLLPAGRRRTGGLPARWTP